jgi:hypothetical protein
MNAIEALQILITADASGIEGVLKSASSDITSFVQKASSKGIDWQKIMSTSAMTFAATSAGALFATMIARTMQFQAALIGASTDASNTFGDNSTAMGASAMNIANTTGQSTDAIAGSLAQTVTHFGDVATGMMITQKAAQAASLGFGDLNKNTQQISDIMKNDMVTSADEVSTKMDQIFVASKESNLSLGEFLTILDNLGPSISAIPFDGLVSSLAAFSKQTGVTGEIAQDVFTKIAEWIALPNSEATIMETATIPGLYRAIQNKDPITALQLIEGEMRKGGIAATTLAQNTGISTNSLIVMGNQGSASTKQLSAGFQQVKKDVEDASGAMDSYVNNNVSDTKQLEKAWQSIQNLLVSIANSPFMADIEKHIGEMADVLSEVVQGVNLPTALQDVIGKATGLTQGQMQASQINDSMQFLQNKLSSAGMTAKESAMVLSKAEQGPNKIENINELVQALSSGTKGMTSTQTANLYSTFNITAPEGGGTQTADDIVKALVRAFNGVNK